MSLLRRINSRDHQRKNLLRLLIEYLIDDESTRRQLRQQVVESAETLNIALTDEDYQAIDDDFAAFLLDPVISNTPRLEPPSPLTPDSSAEAIRQHVRAAFQLWALNNGAWPEFDRGPGYDFFSHSYYGVEPDLSAGLTEIIDALTFVDGTPITLSRVERQRLRDEVFSELIGLGPLDSLLQDDSVTEIFVFPSRRTIVTRAGRMTDIGTIFDNDQHLTRIIERIFAPLGIRVDQQHPAGHARLPDGSRVAAVLPTLSMDGPALTIRKFNPRPLSASDLLAFNTITQQALNILQALIVGGSHILITGGPFSGRTTLLNVLAGFIPEMYRIVTIERRTELMLTRPMTTRLVEVPKQFAPDLSHTDIFQTAVELSPDVILIGDMAQAGIIDLLRLIHRVWGVLAAADGYSPEYALSAIHNWAQAEANRPGDDHLHTMLSKAFDVVVHMEQLTDGRRVVSRIAEVGDSWESGAPALIDLFRFEHSGQKEGRILGELAVTEHAPSSALYRRLQDAGHDI